MYLLKKDSGFLKKLIEIIVVLIASLALLFGLIAMATPLPGATVLAAGSLAVLICVSSRAKRCLKFFRTRWPRLDRGIFWIEGKAGNRVDFIGTALSQTRPSRKEKIPNDED